MITERYIQGSVWWFHRLHGARGITYGKHPCVIISSTCWNSKHDTVVVVPCTSGEVPGALKYPKLELVQSQGNFVPAQVTTIPKGWLSEYLGVVDNNTLFAVVKAVNNLTAMPAVSERNLTAQQDTDRPTENYYDRKPLISTHRRKTSSEAPHRPERFRHNRSTWDRKKRADLLIDYSTLPIEEVIQKWHFKDDSDLIRTIVKIRSMNINGGEEKRNNYTTQG